MAEAGRRLSFLRWLARTGLPVLLGALLWSTTAEAHRLKVFATVEDGAIDGYAFFIGGGRPQGAGVVIRDAGGAPVAELSTSATGDFHWKPPAPGAYDVTVSAGDGHIASARIAADRFLPAGPVTPAPVAMPAISGGVAEKALPAACDPAALEAAVDRAVERQVRPLMEAYAAAEGRVRFNDVAGGLGMIFGLAGVALWVRSRHAGRP